MRKRKLYHELTFTDDFMFWKVMEAHPELGKDPFEKNLPLYEFRTTCLQDPTVAYDDAVRRIVVNAGCTRKDVPDGLKTFFSFLKNGKGKDPLTNRLADAVAKAISRDDWRVEYMKFEILLSKERKEGREEGLAAGLDAGRQEGKILERVKTLRRFHVSDEDIIAEIMRDFELLREDAEEYMKSE